MVQELRPEHNIKTKCNACGKEKPEIESVWLSKDYKKIDDTHMMFWEIYPSGWELVSSSKRMLVMEHFETSFGLNPHWLCPDCRKHELSDYFKVFFLLECFSQELQSLNTDHGQKQILRKV